MKIVGVRNKENQTAQMIGSFVTSHQGRELEWSGSMLNRTSFKNLDNLFKPINGFIATLPQEKQTAIWNCYAEIHELMQTQGELRLLFGKLKKVVKRMYEQFNYEQLRYWVLGYGNIYIPENIYDTYDGNPEDRTYLINDYKELVTLAVALQLMIPVFYQFIFINKNVGNNHKEQYAYGLLAETWIEDIPGAKRLRAYVEANIAREAISVASVCFGLSSTELPDHLYCRAIVKKVALSEVTVVDVNSSIISNVYHYLRNTYKSLDRSFTSGAGRLNPKHNPTDRGGDEDNMSIAETYKVKQEISDGDLIPQSVYTENYQLMANTIDPTITKGLVEMCMRNARKMTHHPIAPHQMTIVQWVMSPVLSPRAIPNLDKPSLLRTIAVTQALMFHWGFKELAVLLTAIPFVWEEDSAMFTVDSRSRITSEAVTSLVELYPYSTRQSGKNSDRQTNAACRAIDALALIMSNNYWAVEVPREKIGEFVFEFDNVITVPADVKSQLVDLLMNRILVPDDFKLSNIQLI